MTRRRRATVATLLLTVCCLGSTLAGAAAAASSPAVADCNANARLTRHYTVAQLRKALATMPADVKEYTDCYDVIQRTLFTQLGTTRVNRSGGGGGSGGGSFLPVPVLIVLIVLVLTAGGYAVAAVRQRSASTERPGGEPPGDGPGPSS